MSGRARSGPPSKGQETSMPQPVLEGMPLAKTAVIPAYNGPDS